MSHELELADITVDAHTHLTDELVIENVEDIISRAVHNNVRSALVVTEVQADFQPVLDLHRRFPHFVLPCLGLHPLQKTGVKDEKGVEILKSISLQDYEGFEEAVEKSLDVIGAIGEVGLDFQPRFCKTADEKEIQKLVLKNQVEIAQKHNLAVNVHSRSAGKPAIHLLKEIGARDVLLHAFDGRASVALEGVGCGFYFSVTASICRDPQTQKMVKCLPIDNLMLETDSPYISPVKGTLNEPANVLISCKHIAELKKMNIQDVKRITTENALKLFPKLKTVLSL